jgi:hypothetical protein
VDGLAVGVAPGVAACGLGFEALEASKDVLVADLVERPLRPELAAPEREHARARGIAARVGGLVGVDELGQRSHLRPGGRRVGSRASAPGWGFFW